MMKVILSDFISLKRSIQTMQFSGQGNVIKSVTLFFYALVTFSSVYLYYDFYKYILDVKHFVRPNVKHKYYIIGIGVCIMVLLGNRIRELRIEYNLTQAELAKQVGVSKATITAYESDSRQPSYDVLIKLANTFKVTLDSLVLNRSEHIIDVSELEPEQINRIQYMVEFYKNSDLIAALHSKEPLDPKTVEKFRENHPELFEKI